MMVSYEQIPALSSWDPLFYLIYYVPIPIIETSKAFGCSGYKSGCKFVLWKFGQHGVYKVLSDNKKKLTKTMAKTLISGKSVTLNNLVSLKTGNTYSAKITMKDAQSFVTLEMNFDIGKKKKGNQK